MFQTTEDSIGRLAMVRGDQLGGVGEHGAYGKGFPGTWEIPSSPSNTGRASPMTSRLAEVGSYPRERTQSTAWSS